MIYEYRCDKCEKVNEFQMKMSDPHPVVCPSCNAQGSLERIISRTSFALKVSGWYTTDYKRSSGSSGGGSGSSSSGASMSGSNTTSCDAQAAAGTACGGGACAVKAEA
jgi:putative FmdB family regulatory protein